MVSENSDSVIKFDGWTLREAISWDCAMETASDLYEVLCVGKNADSRIITLVFRELASRHHPDKNLDNVEWATKKMQEINDAYRILSDPVRRARYDQQAVTPKKESHQTPVNSGRQSFTDGLRDFFKALFGRL